MRNFLSLASIQASNAVLPLFIFPYGLKVLGVEHYAKIAISQTWIYFIVTLVLYSFTITGVQDIVVNSDNVKEMSRTFFEILFTRLFIFSFCVLFVLASYLFCSREAFILLILWLMFPLGYIFQASYFFIAVENNYPAAIITLSTRLLCVVLIVFLVRKPSDYLLFPVIIGGAFLLGGLLSTGYLICRYRLQYSSVNRHKIFVKLLEGKEIFLANLSVIFYKDFNLIILACFPNSSFAVAIFSVASKFVTAFQAGIRPLNQVYFPKIARLLVQQKNVTRNAFLQILVKTVPQLISLTVIILIITVVAYLSRSYYMDYSHIHFIIKLIAIMVIAVYFGIINFMFGSAGLILLGEKCYYARIMLQTAVLSVGFGFLLCYLFSALGAAYNFVLSEVFLSVFVLVKYTKTSNDRR